jgi:hypothetical protein
MGTRLYIGSSAINDTDPGSVFRIAPSYSGTGDLSGGGYGLRLNSGTYTNATTLASGTVASASLASLDGGVIASTNAGVVYTNAATLRIAGAPTGGTNSTITNAWALWVASGNSYFQGSLTSTGTIVAPTVISTDAGARTWGANDYNGTVTFQFGRNVRILGGTDYMGLTSNTGFGFTSGGVAAFSISNVQIAALFGSTFSFNMGNGMTLKGRLGVSTGGLYSNNPSSTTDGAIYTDGGVFIYSSFTNHAASTIFDVQSTVKGSRPFPAMSNAQITAISSPALFLSAMSTTDERIHVKRTSGFFQVAYTQDVKRDTTYKTVNANLDLSGLTTTFQNRYRQITIETIVTAAATGNNTITLPAPTAALANLSFKVSVEDTSGDGDISVLSFGTDGTDGYLYNGDGTYATSQNLFPGFGVYVSVSWCEAKGAYRWKLQ